MPRLGMRSALWFLILAGPLTAGPWPQWRGPQGTGHCDETGVPWEWSESQNVVWKAPLPDGASTPIVWGEAIFVTAQEGERLQLIRLDRATGKKVWTREVATGTATQDVPRGRRADRGQQKFHRLHNLATPSPVTDGSVVAVHFGNGWLAVLDFNGTLLWKRNLQDELGTYTIWWGHGNSPVIVGDLLINACMQDSLTDLGKPPAASYLVAHELKTGKQRWLTPRPTDAVAEEWDSYTTPLLRERDGRRELVVMGSNQLDAYDPATGRQLWSVTGLQGGRTITGPTLGGDLVFATRGMRKPLVAVKPAGPGQQPASAIVWEQTQGTPDCPTPVFHQGRLYWITDNGIAHCADAADGKILWRERLTGDFKASPIVAENRLYFLNLAGKCTVLAAGPRFQKLAENSVADETIASLAVADGSLYLRGRKALYRIQAPR